MEDAFDISEKTAGGVSVVSAAGEIDIATAPGLRQQLESTMDRSGGLVVVDLLKVTFIDSTALGVLIGALKRSQESGGTMRLVVAEPRVLKVFEITGLTELFSIFPTIDAAVQG